MSAILKALERVQGERPEGEEGPERLLPPAPSGARGFSSGEPSRSRPIVWAGAALALMGVGLAGGALIWGWNAGPGESMPTEFASVTAQPDLERPPPARAPLGTASPPEASGPPQARRPLVPVPAETPLPQVDVAQVPRPAPDRAAPTARPLGRTTLASARPSAADAPPGAPAEPAERANPPMLPSALGARPPMPPQAPERPATRPPTRMPQAGAVPAASPATEPLPPPAPAAAPAPTPEPAATVVARSAPAAEPLAPAPKAEPKPAPNATPVAEKPAPRPAPKPAPKKATPVAKKPAPKPAPKAKPALEPKPAPKVARAVPAAAPPAPARPLPAAMADEANPFAVVEPTPELHIESTVWHPSPLRRAARVRVPGRDEPLELREGDAVGRLVVGEIQPSGVVFLQDGTEYRRAVGE